MIFFGGFFDFFDGFVARLLKVNNPIGKDLDSLADMVTFGLLPSFIVYNSINDKFLSFIALSIAVMSALRLAQFNNDAEQKTIFKGLPTPALALFFASLILAQKFQYVDILDKDYVWAILAVVFSIMLVLPMKMLSLKFEQNFSFKVNWYRYLFMLIVIFLILIFRFWGISFSIVIYILYSFVIYKF